MWWGLSTSDCIRGHIRVNKRAHLLFGQKRGSLPWKLKRAFLKKQEVDPKGTTSHSWGGLSDKDGRALHWLQRAPRCWNSRLSYVLQKRQQSTQQLKIELHYVVCQADIGIAPKKFVQTKVAMSRETVKISSFFLNFSLQIFYLSLPGRDTQGSLLLLNWYPTEVLQEKGRTTNCVMLEGSQNGRGLPPC